MLVPTFAVERPEDFLYLEASEGKESRGIGLHRVSTQDISDLKEVEYRLSRKIKNTATQKFENRGYIGKIKWDQAIHLNLLQGQSTPSLADMREGLYLARRGITNNIPVYDCKGDKIPKEKLGAFLSEVTEASPSWRAEHIDAKFEKEDNQLFIAYGHRMQAGNLIPLKREPLQPCLMQDKIPGISLEDWLSRATPQGLPPADAHTGQFYYWFPRAKSVARFRADSGGVDLYCYGGRRVSFAALGVRSMISAAGAQKFLDENQETPKQEIITLTTQTSPSLEQILETADPFIAEKLKEEFRKAIQKLYSQ
ncbi:MAG: hypothetical protein AABX86_00790 [Nanoarchaeota archaeon]